MKDSIRVGDTMRRPPGPGFEACNALLVHLESVGFERAPRFLGIDDEGRSIVEYVPGDAVPNPSWQHDDEANARRLGEIAAALHELHQATADFVAPDDAAPYRSLPLAGSVWTHADCGYPNLVYRDDAFVAFIDWEFAAPGDPLHDPASLLAASIRGPRRDVTGDDHDRRVRAEDLAAKRILAGYGLDESSLPALRSAAAAVADDIADFLVSELTAEQIDAWRWRAEWFRQAR